MFTHHIHPPTQVPPPPDILIKTYIKSKEFSPHLHTCMCNILGPKDCSYAEDISEVDYGGSSFHLQFVFNSMGKLKWTLAFVEIIPLKFVIRLI